MVELLTGEAHCTPIHSAMQWGRDVEPLARSAYEAQRGVLVDVVGFIVHPAYDWLGASPDGLMPDRGLEIKCPANSSVHVSTLENGLPPEHYAQLQIGMACTGLKRWDFVSFDPRMPEPLRLYIQTVARDALWIDNAIAECAAFFTDCRNRAEALKRRTA